MIFLHLESSIGKCLLNWLLEWFTVFYLQALEERLTFMFHFGVH